MRVDLPRRLDVGRVEVVGVGEAGLEPDHPARALADRRLAVHRQVLDEAHHDVVARHHRVVRLVAGVREVAEAVHAVAHAGARDVEHAVGAQSGLLGEPDDRAAVAVPHDDDVGARRDDDALAEGDELGREILRVRRARGIRNRLRQRPTGPHEHGRVAGGVVHVLPEAVGPAPRADVGRRAGHVDRDVLDPLRDVAGHRVDGPVVGRDRLLRGIEHDHAGALLTVEHAMLVDPGDLLLEEPAVLLGKRVGVATININAMTMRVVLPSRNSSIASTE